MVAREGAQFRLSDIEWTMTGTGDADADGSSTQATRPSPYDNFRPHNTPDSSEPNWISEQQQSFNVGPCEAHAETPW